MSSTARCWKQPPAVAEASQTNQVVANSFSGVLAHLRRGAVDLKMGTVLLVGGLIGYGNDYRAENCYGYGAVSAAAGTVGGTVGKDSGRSTNVRSNLYYLTGSCAYACGGKAEVSGVARLRLTCDSFWLTSGSIAALAR